MLRLEQEEDVPSDGSGSPILRRIAWVLAGIICIIIVAACTVLYVGITGRSPFLPTRPLFHQVANAEEGTPRPDEPTVPPVTRPIVFPTYQYAVDHIRLMPVADPLHPFDPLHTPAP